MINIIGHQGIRETLNKSVIKDTLSHGHLIVGEDGIGKSLVAKELAMNILNKTINRDYADIIDFRCTGKSIGVDDIRNIIEEINKKPFEEDKKVIILHNGDDMTVQGQNAFLKTIEEPPKGVYIIILCESDKGILDTIKSRCQIHKLNSLTDEEMKTYIRNKFSSIDDATMRTLLAFSEGIPGRVDNYMTNKSFKDIRELTLRILMDINSRDTNVVVNYSKEINEKYKNFFKDILNVILFYVRDIIVYKELGDEKYILNQDITESIKKLSLNMSFNKLNAIVRVINETRNNLDRNVNAVMTFDVMLMNMLEG